MYTIENEQLRVVIDAAGAELQSLFNKVTGLEYLWNGDAQYWAKRSPVLFPIVGTLKDNQYHYHEKTYHLGRHGFARDSIFSVSSAAPSSISFELKSNANTLLVFPFQFVFTITYSLSENTLSVTYQVANKTTESLFFSVGGHPAFRLPLADGLLYSDYYLRFNKIENAGHWPISSDGLIETAPLPLLNNTDRLPMTKSLFYRDALVFKHLQSDAVQLRSDLHPAGIDFSFEGFPYLGIWAAKDADFICIEPWCGIADSVNTSQEFTKKEGVVYLSPAESFERTWRVTTF